MPRRAEEPLELKKGIRLFQGDWERLGSLLSYSHISPALFIRHLVRNKILELEAAKAAVARPVEVNYEIPLDGSEPQ